MELLQFCTKPSIRFRNNKGRNFKLTQTSYNYVVISNNELIELNWTHNVHPQYWPNGWATVGCLLCIIWQKIFHYRTKLNFIRCYKSLKFQYCEVYGSGKECAPVVLPGFAIKSQAGIVIASHRILIPAWDLIAKPDKKTGTRSWPDSYRVFMPSSWMSVW